MSGCPLVVIIAENCFPHATRALSHLALRLASFLMTTMTSSSSAALRRCHILGISNMADGASYCSLMYLLLRVGRALRCHHSEIQFSPNSQSLAGPRQAQCADSLARFCLQVATVRRGALYAV